MVRVWRDNGAYVFTTKKLTVDVDGAPNAYGPDDKGIEFICNGAVAYDEAAQKCVFKANDKKHWQTRCKAAFAKAKAEKWQGPTKMCTFGFKAVGGTTDARGRVIGGVPLVQDAHDPKPGYYVTLTSLKRPETEQYKGDVQARQVDATKVPYYVLPPDVAESGDIKLGDIAAVWYPGASAPVFAVYGDGGPADALGEGSAKLHEMLGNNVYVTKNGVRRAENDIDDGVTFVIFSNSGDKAPARYNDPDWVSAIQSAGRKLFAGDDGGIGWGGLKRLKACRAKP